MKKVISLLTVLMIVVVLVPSCKPKPKTRLEKLKEKVENFNPDSAASNATEWVKEKQKKLGKAAKRLQQKITQQPRNPNSGKDTTLYFNDYPNKIATIEINRSCRFFPIGGKVEITPPNGDSSWVSKPGIDEKHSLNDGKFFFKGIGKARGIQIVWK